MDRSLFSASSPGDLVAIERLVQAKILREIPDDRRPKLFYSPEIFNIAYRDLNDADAFAE